MDAELIVMLVIGAAALVMAGGIYTVGKPTNVTGVLEATTAALSDIECVRCGTGICTCRRATLADGTVGEIESVCILRCQSLPLLFPDMPQSTLEESVEAAVAWVKMAEGKLITKE